MELVNAFTVNAPIDKAWATLTDLELIAPCMPGAQLTEIEGENYRGHVKVKVGPITAQFKGQAHFVERDEINHRAVLRGEGRDTGGKGNASALITAQLDPVSDTSTKCVVTTDLTITGKVAQFGRGAMADVSDKLLKQFVHNLETKVLSQGGATEAPVAATGETPTPAAPPPADAAPGGGAADEATAVTGEVLAPPTGQPAGAPDEAPKARKVDSKPAEPIDLIETAGATMLKRLAPIAVVVLLILFLLRRRKA